MIFTSLKLNNIGLYKGDNVLSLHPRDNKNIILLGGKNGAGKTTILEAIKLCLYGNNIYGYSKSGYSKFIEKIIHRGESSGYIELEFSYFSEFTEERYKVLRRFDISNGFKEEFILYKEGKIFSEIPIDYWQELIYQIIPAGLVNFFFFDGEKIERLADNLTKTEMIDDIKNLIGALLIDELYINLNIIKIGYLKSDSEEKEKEVLEKIENFQQEKITLEKELGMYIQEKAKINLKIESILKEYNKLVEELERKGGNLNNKYQLLMKKREHLINEIAHIKNEIKRLSQSILPLALGIDLLEELIKQLEVEKKIKRCNLEREILEKKFHQVHDLLMDINMQPDKMEKLHKIFLDIELPEGTMIHNLSENEMYKIINVYENLKDSIIPNVRKLFKNLEAHEEELAQIEISIQSIPKEETLAPYINKIRKLEEERLKLVKQAEDIDKKIKEHQKNMNKLEREISKLNDVVSKNHKNEDIINTIDKLQVILEIFKKELIRKKVSILEKEILESLLKLGRKENFITDIDINPDTFEIKLYDRDKRVIPLDKLSAGERQIFAISFLWGLIKTTRRALPVIIDTPLGRLDSSHRENLAKSYFPNVSHQVILLSTDTEIDERLYNLMKNSISHGYSLLYNNKCMCTEVKEGYFLREVAVNEI